MKEKEERELKLKEYREARAKKSSQENAGDKDERIKRGLTQLGLESAKPSESGSQEDVMNKRRALFANIKQGLADDN